jgi:hypothetical protein
MITKAREFKDEYIIIAIDSTGIKVTIEVNEGRDKYHIENKKGYLKIHIAVNAKSKKILSRRVTDDEHVHDGRRYQSWSMVL